MIATSTRVLEWNERIAEILFGLIMVRTFTGSLSVAEAGRADIRSMLVGALGCNLAWGIIDGVLYLMAALAGRGRDLAVYSAIRNAAPADGHRAILDAVPPIIGSVLDPFDLEQVRQRLTRLPEAPVRPRLVAAEWRGAVAVCLLVFASTFPVALPFLLIGDAPTALRVSNGVAVTMLFLAGAAYGQAVHRSPLAIGTAMVVLGAVLVAMTMALGG
jgi:VIT1/CCC1 family predicted Fe2+/Mn2+ transporter